MSTPNTPDSPGAEASSKPASAPQPLKKVEYVYLAPETFGEKVSVVVGAIKTVTELATRIALTALILAGSIYVL